MNIKLKSIIYTVLLLLVGVTLIYQSFTIYRLSEKVSNMEASSQGISSLTNPNFPAASSQVSPDPWTTNQPTINDPFANLRNMQQQMDSLFGSVFQSQRLSFPGNGTINIGNPAIEVNETPDSYKIEIEIPPGSEIELSTQIEDNVVELAGEVNYKGGTGNNQLSTSFTSVSQFSRSIPLNKPVDPLGLYTDWQDDRVIISVPKT